PKAPARRGPPQTRHPRVDPGRRVAYEVLTAVEEQDAYANLVLPGLLRDRRLDTRDAALATELAYGVLRGQGLLDPILAACSSRPLDQVDPPLRRVLRLGAHQLLRTRIPAHAAVSATVDLARTVTTAGPAAFANAVLRKVSERDLEAWLARVAPDRGEDPVGHLAVVHSHPRWVVTAFRDALGGDLVETEAALAADDARPHVHLAARPGRSTRDELLEQVGEAGELGPFSPYAVRLTGGGDPRRVPAVGEGRAGVQDEGSQLTALALAAVPIDGDDRRWLDVCAGPGGKATLLAGLAGERGAALLANEVQPHRARLVVRGLAGSGTATMTVTADGRVPAWRDGAFDRVLVDAPCTGLGALRRRPEARWRRQPSDLPGLTKLQRELLTAALAAVRPGGVVAYVTCSPHLAETRVPVLDVVRRGGAELLDARAALPDGVPHLGDGPTVQLWPHRHGTDAMHLALLRRH
ncbi:MAG: rRNA cytosine-C5-methyltransferase, partial [Actinomycetota bacterium]|nr:rRNA cytosine-C5-methyltransferase [Actinomycetota bacterium]